MKIVNNYIFEFVKNPEIIYIVPTNDKPVKIVYEDYPCPIDSNMRCKCAEMIVENDVISIKCNYDNRYCIFDIKTD